MTTTISDLDPVSQDPHVCWEVKTDTFGKALRLRSLPAPLLTDSFQAVRGVSIALKPNGEYELPSDTLSKLLSTPPFVSRCAGHLSPKTRVELSTVNLSSGPSSKRTPQAKQKQVLNESTAPDIENLDTWYRRRQILHK